MVFTHAFLSITETSFKEGPLKKSLRNTIISCISLLSPLLNGDTKCITSFRSFVAFFFSAIASQEKKKGSINENTDEESSSEDEIPSSFSQQWLEGNLTIVNKSLCPAIAYWVALTTVNGAPASPISVHKALLNSGLEVTATQVIKLFSYFLITQAFP